MKLCIECKHYIRETGWPRSFCRALEADISHGWEKYQRCDVARYGGECGPEGKLWEQKS